MATLLTIEGPTGSGKTDLAISVASSLDCSIVSADSRQVFRELVIGSAAPASEQLLLVKHYFVADRSVTEPFNAGIFASEANELLNTLFQESAVQVLCGGSGLYVNALVMGLNELPQSDPAIRLHYLNLLSSKGIDALGSLLSAKDPDYYKVVDLQNPQRLIRALEVIELTGKPYSEYRKGSVKPDAFEVRRFAIDMPREELYSRINNRVDIMMESGLLEEARGLYPLRHLNALQTVGYSELFSYFDMKYTLDEAISLIKQHTRNYAKRQLTWLRKQAGVTWITSAEEILTLI